MGNIRHKRERPEWYIQRDLKQFLRDRGWWVEQTHGNIYQTGLPDLFIARKDHGYRWIDVKVTGRYSFTNAQKIKWPILDSFGVGIWVLTAATQEQYDLLFEPPNWKSFWRDSWGPIDIDALLDTLDE